MEARLQKMRVVDLRKELDKFGLSKTGLKADLVERLLEHYESSTNKEDSENDENESPNVAPPRKSKRPAKTEKEPQKAKAVVEDEEESSSNQQDDEMEVEKEEPQKVEEKKEPKKQNKQEEKTESTQIQTSISVPEKVEVAKPKPAPSVSRPEKKNTELDFANLFKQVDQKRFSSALQTVSEQCHPQLKLAPSAIKLLKNYIIFAIQKMFSAAEIKVTKSVTVTGLQHAVTTVYRNDLAKYAIEEALKAIERLQYAKGHGVTIDDELTSHTKLVFPINLFTGLLNSLGVLRFIIDENASVFLSAIIEYLVAEILELSGNSAEQQLKENITSVHIMHSIKGDSELSELFADYATPASNEDQQNAIQSWKEKSSQLYEILSMLPSEELPSIVSLISEKLRVIDATATVKDTLQFLIEEARSEEIANDIRRLSKYVSIKDTLGTQQAFAEQHARTKMTNFTIEIPSQNKKNNSDTYLTFSYQNQITDVLNDKNWVQMSVNGSSLESTSLDGILWSNEDFEGEYRLNTDLLDSILRLLDSKMNAKEFVQFLLCIAEAENGGGVGNVCGEIGKMEYCHLFDPIGMDQDN